MFLRRVPRMEHGRECVLVCLSCVELYVGGVSADKVGSSGKMHRNTVEHKQGAGLRRAGFRRVR